MNFMDKVILKYNTPSLIDFNLELQINDTGIVIYDEDPYEHVLISWDRPNVGYSEIFQGIKYKNVWAVNRKSLQILSSNKPVNKFNTFKERIESRHEHKSKKTERNLNNDF